MYNRRKNETIFAAKWGLTPHQYRMLRKHASAVTKNQPEYYQDAFEMLLLVVKRSSWEYYWKNKETFEYNASVMSKEQKRA